jgi:flagellar hook-associated protein 3 FlgL
MISRVASFSISQEMIDAAMRTESTMASEQLQEASGEISSDYGGLGQTSQQVIDLQVSVTRSQSYIDSANSADNQVQVMYSTLGSVTDLYTQLRSLLTGASNSVSTDPTSVAETAQQMLQEMTSLLNTQYAGQYLFGGSNTTSPPVDTSSAAYPPATSPSTASTSYYQGDDSIASARVSDTESVSYGVTADNPAFEQGLRALNLVANNVPLSTSTLNEALNLATNALDAATAVQTGLGVASSSLESASAAQTDLQSYAKTLGSNLTSVDVAAVTAQLSTYQAQLTASYSAISKVQSLNLASYLH